MARYVLPRWDSRDHIGTWVRPPRRRRRCRRPPQLGVSVVAFEAMPQRVLAVVTCLLLLPSCSATRRASVESAEVAPVVDGEPSTMDGGGGSVPGAASPAPPPAGLCRPTSREPGSVPAEERLPGPIRRVSILVEPADGGMAHRDVEADGRVNGGHLSGDRGAPMVSQESGRVSAECVEAVWQAAARVVAAAAGTDQGAPSSEGGTTTLRIILHGDDAVEVRWPFRQEPTQADARALVALLQEMGIGYW